MKSIRKGFLFFNKESYKTKSEFDNINSKHKVRQTYGHNIREIFFLGYEYPDQDYVIPGYQRPLVLPIEQKRALISILKGLSIGDFLFAVINHNGFQPIDGQQRVNPIREFVLDKFKISTYSEVTDAYLHGHPSLVVKLDDRRFEIKFIEKSYSIYIPRSHGNIDEHGIIGFKNKRKLQDARIIQIAKDIFKDCYGYEAKTILAQGVES